MKTQPKILTLALLGVLSGAWAADDAASTQQLQNINVSGSRVAKTLGKERVNRKKLDENLVQDIHDMVRYDPGISVVEGGRAGSNGFAIRGVDKDRVAITVDGIAQSESRSSEGFQEIFGAYGNFNTNRNAGELETIRAVDIAKGADSISAGSGALGGAVMYQTKTPSDFLQDKNWYLGQRFGYTSKNRQWMSSTTLAGRLGGFDGLFIYTKRDGHETKNHANSDEVSNVYEQNNLSYGKVYTGKTREVPDPQKVHSKSTLVRGGYYFNENNYLSLIYEDYRQDRHTDEFSNLLRSIGSQNDARFRDDITYRTRSGISYENQWEGGLWDKLTVSYDRQKISMKTFTWDTVYPEFLTPISQSAYMNRGLYQKSDDFKLAAEKSMAFKYLTWDMNYGAGYNKTRNSTDNLEYWVYAFYPQRRTSTTNLNEFLVSAQKRSYYGYLTNRFRLFDNRLRLNLGARYDLTKMSTLESETLNPHVKRQLELQGVWNKSAKFKAPSYSTGLDLDVSKNITLQAKYSTGFRAPTTDEMYFFFPSSIVYIKPNPDLKEEKARNVELGIDLHGKWGNAKLSAFRTKYRNFIDFVPLSAANSYVPQYNYNTMNYGLTRYQIPSYQNINRSNAVVKGLEWQSVFQLGYIGLPQGSYLSMAASYNKGRADGNVPINAVQPFNGVIGLGYKQPEDKWSLGVNLSYFARKKPEDTTKSYDEQNEVFPYARYSRNIWLTDLIGHYRVNKNFMIRAGVFNLFDKEYYTWDSLRSIRQFGAVNRVDNCLDDNNVPQHANCAHKGIKRFTAPGRNFSVMVEAKF